MVHTRLPQSSLTFNHLSHHGTKACIAMWKITCIASVTRRWQHPKYTMVLD